MRKWGFREFCLISLRSEIQRITYTIPELKKIKSQYKKLKQKLMAKARDEDTVIDIMALHSEFFDEYDKMCDAWEKNLVKKEEAKKEESKKEKTENENNQTKSA